MNNNEDYVIFQSTSKDQQVWITFKGEEIGRLTPSDFFRIPSISDWAEQTIALHKDGLKMDEPAIPANQENNEREQIIIRLQKELDKPRSLVGYATVPTELLEGVILELRR